MDTECNHAIPKIYKKRLLGRQNENMHNRHEKKTEVNGVKFGFLFISARLRSDVNEIKTDSAIIQQDKDIDK
jgi:hypothetical protein